LPEFTREFITTQGYACSLFMMMIHRTLTKLTFGATHQPATMEISMISADLSGKELWPSGASVLAAFLPKCTYVLYMYLYPLLFLQSDIPNTLSSDIRAILSVNLLKNDIGTDQATALVDILSDHPSLKSLCGNKGNETELDMSGKMDGAEDAIMLAAEIIDNRALSSLDVRGNQLCNREAGKALSQMLAANTVLTELDISNNTGYGARDGPGFAQELSSGISGNGALTNLDISENNLTNYGDDTSGKSLKWLDGLQFDDFPFLFMYDRCYRPSECHQRQRGFVEPACREQ
jgi:hypothetical protein